MTTTVILGAGDLGGAVARHLAATDLVSAITLVDEAESVAQGKALDIRQAGAIERYVTLVAGTAAMDAVIGTSVVVVADTAARSLEWQEDAAVGLIARVAALNPTAPILCAGAMQASTIERVVRETGIPRQRIFGTAPDALRSGVIAITALEAGCVTTDVSLSVIGRPPHHIIVPWEDASIAGRRATSVLTPPAIARIDSRLTRLWPPGPLTLAAAATRAIRAAVARAPRAICAFVSVGREEGGLGRVAMLPVILTARGIGAVVTPALSGRDRVRFDTCLSS